VLPVLLAVTHAQAQAPGAWLDGDPAAWTQTAVVPAAPAARQEPREVLARRCAAPPLAGTPPAAALARAGWVPYLHLDREIARDGTEVIGGMSAAGPGCAPEAFNLFVFVGGAFAGTLAPAPMAPNRDGEAGAVRITSAEELTAEFARYASGDPECCPSSRVRVTYGVERRNGNAVLQAGAVRRIR
jgi:hypothetical protein